MANILAVIFGLILLAGVSFVGWLAFDWIRLLHRKRRLDKKMRKQMKELDEMFAQLEAQLKESSHE